MKVKNHREKIRDELHETVGKVLDRELNTVLMAASLSHKNTASMRIDLDWDFSKGKLSVAADVVIPSTIARYLHTDVITGFNGR
ncbi:hypothetical protein H5P28_11885 [Ruficoccus amylovorans]|uniref:Uncharacterized protein n=1 Tax=Ruficoccus amylovorans TaxID=1804625 RepID=A0A842HG00_9BACT|nr:hypothetical protein [Ruficoccus amylovorans]MBC2594958.1 hypothetical protein [Ruficoccus amylovorans]